MKIEDLFRVKESLPDSQQKQGEQDAEARFIVDSLDRFGDKTVFQKNKKFIQIAKVGTFIMQFSGALFAAFFIFSILYQLFPPQLSTDLKTGISLLMTVVFLFILETLKTYVFNNTAVTIFKTVYSKGAVSFSWLLISLLLLSVSSIVSFFGSKQTAKNFTDKSLYIQTISTKKIDSLSQYYEEKAVSVEKNLLDSISQSITPQIRVYEQTLLKRQRKNKWWGLTKGENRNLLSLKKEKERIAFLMEKKLEAISREKKMALSATEKQTELKLSKNFNQSNHAEIKAMIVSITFEILVVFFYLSYAKIQCLAVTDKRNEKLVKNYYEELTPSQQLDKKALTTSKEEESQKVAFSSHQDAYEAVNQRSTEESTKRKIGFAPNQQQVNISLSIMTRFYKEKYPKTYQAIIDNMLGENSLTLYQITSIGEASLSTVKTIKNYIKSDLRG